MAPRLWPATTIDYLTIRLEKIGPDFHTIPHTAEICGLQSLAAFRMVPFHIDHFSSNEVCFHETPALKCYCVMVLINLLIS